uniref:Lipoma HMGIC fusion partner-like 2 protein n=1 Tax=Glossina morsitans morsitans TaxID=37546 RepID=A0A1B0G0P2_GLOMM
MCYIIITGGSLIWFLLTLIADMLIASAIVTPKWLIGPAAYTFAITSQSLQQENVTKSTAISETPITTTTTTAVRYPSVGIYTRCKAMKDIGFHCGPFDLDGFATDSSIYPTAWKASMFFISLGFVLLTLTVLCTLISCCRQSVFGKSIHNMTACAQVIAGISVMLALFLHPVGWSAARVQLLCGPDAEPFYAAGCSIGISFYCAATGILLCFMCAGISIKAESSNMRSHVKRRVEEGERLVCIP